MIQRSILLTLLAATTLCAQTLTILDRMNRSNGDPTALVPAPNGDFYGTTRDNGTIFKMTPRGAFTTIYRFCEENGCPDGTNPNALVLAADGDFYGTTTYAGANTLGTVFKITPAGRLTTLYSFCPQPDCADGGNPFAGLIQAADRNLYGTTPAFGAYNGGTLFKITSSGTLTTLHTFCSQSSCADGAQPEAALVQASNGNIYGSTYTGGTRNSGTLFKLTPSGVFTTIYTFCSLYACADGANPSGAMIQAADGSLYGTTSVGGAHGQGGTLYKLTPDGRFETFYSFCGQPNCTDGAAPAAGLVQASDGNFYGTTQFAGANGNYGTIFSVTPAGVGTTLYSFCAQGGCKDGAYPVTPLVQATSGNLYGTAGGKGNFINCCGTIFTLSLDNLSSFYQPSR